MVYARKRNPISQVFFTYSLVASAGVPRWYFLSSSTSLSCQYEAAASQCFVRVSRTERLHIYIVFLNQVTCLSHPSLLCSSVWVKLKANIPWDIRFSLSSRLWCHVLSYPSIVHTASSPRHNKPSQNIKVNFFFGSCCCCFKSFCTTTYFSYNTGHHLLVTWCFNAQYFPVSPCLSAFLRIQTQNV